MTNLTLLEVPDGPPPGWEPGYEPWRHGGWYVTGVRYASGAAGCVSRNFTDRKWRIVCHPAPFDEQPTFPNRDAAARAEWVLAFEEVNRKALAAAQFLRYTFEPRLVAAIGHAMVFCCEDASGDPVLVDPYLAQAAGHFYPVARILASGDANVEPESGPPVLVERRTAHGPTTYGLKR